MKKIILCFLILVGMVLICWLIRLISCFSHFSCEEQGQKEKRKSTRIANKINPLSSLFST